MQLSLRFDFRNPSFAGTSMAAAAASAPAPFKAVYQVQRDGQTIGQATITLTAQGGGQYAYRNQTQGTAGLAALLGASSSETTRFRWHGDAPETVSYDYAMDAAIKQKRRHMAVDWTAGKVTVDEGKGPITYASTAGMVDRNTLPLALGLLANPLYQPLFEGLILLAAVCLGALWVIRVKNRLQIFR